MLQSLTFIARQWCFCQTGSQLSLHLGAALVESHSGILFIFTFLLLQVKMVYDIFSDSGVLDFFKIEERKIMAFIAAVCSHYHRNPYHNFCHVVYVLHTTYMMLMRSQISKSLNRVDQLVLLIAALCHDVDHDGKTISVTGLLVIRVQAT